MLVTGDTIAFVGLSDPRHEREWIQLETLKNFFASYGVNVFISPLLYEMECSRPVWAKELMRLFEHPDVKAIFDVSGGNLANGILPYLDFERLKEIHKLIPDTPLVLHGASTVLKEFVDKCNEYGGNIPGAQGVPEDMIRESTKYGICKVNIDTDLRLALTAEIRKFLAENPAEFDPRKYLGPGRDAIRAMVQHKIRNVLNASGSM